MFYPLQIILSYYTEHHDPKSLGLFNGNLAFRSDTKLRSLRTAKSLIAPEVRWQTVPDTFFPKSRTIFIRLTPFVHFLTPSFHSKSKFTVCVCLGLIRLTSVLPLTPKCEQSVCAVSGMTCLAGDTVFPWTRLSPLRNLAWNQSKGATFHRCGFAAASWRSGPVSEIQFTKERKSREAENAVSTRLAGTNRQPESSEPSCSCSHPRYRQRRNSDRPSASLL